MFISPRESHQRSLAKAITWRATGSLDTLVVSYLVTGNFIFAGSIATAETLTKVVLYYLHERTWSAIGWRKKSTNASVPLGSDACTAGGQVRPPLPEHAGAQCAAGMHSTSVPGSGIAEQPWSANQCAGLERHRNLARLSMPRPPLVDAPPPASTPMQPVISRPALDATFRLAQGHAWAQESEQRPRA